MRIYIIMGLLLSLLSCGGAAESLTEKGFTEEEKETFRQQFITLASNPLYNYTNGVKITQ